MSSSFGFVSHAWNVLTGSFYFISQTSMYFGANTSIPGTDLANVAPQCGVYFYPSNAQPIAIPTSFNNLADIDADKKDHSIMVYPNFGVQMFSSANYGGTSSPIQYNITSRPILIPSTNATISIKVFYQGTQLTTLILS